MRKSGIAVIVMAMLSACGGRVANPVPTDRTIDDALSCAHISAEAEVNAARILDLLGEKQAANENNAALILALPLSVAFPFFLDLGDAEQQEIRALEARTKRLDALGTAKGCPLKTASEQPA